MTNNSNKLQAIRGMNDILPHQTPHWQYLEKTIRGVMQSYHYHEIRMPILEPLALFARGVGESTDIVEKEMYAFEDRNGDQLCLRPEGTAGCVRAGIEHGLFYNQTQKLWYLGPMYRHERPQKGRYRQFYHWGVETYGYPDPYIDAELIALSFKLFKQLGLDSDLTLEINSLGSAQSRANYVKVLVDYLNQHLDQLDQDSVRRLGKNPLRILDSKNPAMAELLEQAPQIKDYLDQESQLFYQKFKQALDELKIPYRHNPRLVRGIDYYTHAVFEWTTTQLGAQATVCAGGRYDGLVEQLGGAPTPACGFALGCERVLLLLEQLDQLPMMGGNSDIYMISGCDQAHRANLVLAEQLRDHFPNKAIEVNAKPGSLKSQFKKADKSGALLALVMADDELANHSVAVKFLREERSQQVVSIQELPQLLHSFFAGLG